MARGFRRICAVATLASLGPIFAQNRGTVTVDITSTYERVNPELFGLDLEFTRHDMWEGLSAQLVANRQFAVQPKGTQWPYAWPAGFPPRWQPIGSPNIIAPQQGVQCSLSSSVTLCGVQQVPVGDGFDSGLSFGSAIGLRSRATYTLSVTATVTLSMTGNMNVQVELPGVGSTTMNFVGLGMQRTLSWTFLSPVTVTNASLMMYVTGPAGNITFASVSLVPTAGTSFGNLRADTIAQLKALSFQGPLRYPGGCFAPFYNWKSQLGLYETRPTQFTPPDYCTAVAGGVNAYTDGFMENGPNIDEYIQLCRETGVTPAITISLQFGTAQEIKDAADWVEYCNGNINTTWGAIRTNRGYPEPYNVSIWYLGNEMNIQLRYANYPTDITSTPPPTATEYAGMLTELVPAMLAVDPTLQLLAVSGDGDWDATWAAVVGPHVAATSYHGGYDYINGGTPSTPEDFTTDAKFPTTTFLSGLQGVRDGLNAANAANVAISCDEWGLGPPWVVQQFNVAHGMFGASFLGVMIRNASTVGVRFSNYFEPINEGAISVGQFSAGPTPLGMVMPYFANYSGTTRVGYSLGPNTSPAGSDDDIDVVAALLPGSSAVLLTLSNRNSTQSYVQPVIFDGAPEQTFGPAANVQLLTASGLEPDSVFIPSSSQVRVNAGGRAQFTVPPYSILQAVVPVQG